MKCNFCLLINFKWDCQFGFKKVRTIKFKINKIVYILLIQVSDLIWSRSTNRNCITQQIFKLSLSCSWWNSPVDKRKLGFIGAGQNLLKYCSLHLLYRCSYSGAHQILIVRTELILSLEICNISCSAELKQRIRCMISMSSNNSFLIDNPTLENPDEKQPRR